MASEIRRPGAPPGLEAMVTREFDVPVTPTLGAAEAARRVREKIGSEQLSCERLDISDVPVQRGSLFDMSGVRVLFPEGEAYDTCYVALIDPLANTQWAHPAHWAFVPADGRGDVVLRPTNFPENATGGVRLYKVPLS